MQRRVGKRETAFIFDQFYQLLLSHALNLYFQLWKIFNMLLFLIVYIFINVFVGFEKFNVIIMLLRSGVLS